MAAATPDIGELLAALQGAGGASGMGPGMAPTPESAPTAGGSEDEPISILKDMIGLAQQYLQVEPDEEDKATMASVLATLQKYLAKDQQDAEKLLGGGALSRTLRRTA